MVELYAWPGGDVHSRENRARRSSPDKKPRRRGKKTIDSRDLALIRDVRGHPGDELQRFHRLMLRAAPAPKGNQVEKMSTAVDASPGEWIILLKILVQTGHKQAHFSRYLNFIKL